MMMIIKLYDLIKSHFNILEDDSKQSISQNRYKQILIHLSDGIHNYQEPSFFANNNIDKKIYEKNLRDFFSYIRFIQLDQDLCTEEKYQQILQYIKNDFYNYFCGKSNQIDFEKFKSICEGR